MARTRERDSMTVVSNRHFQAFQFSVRAAILLMTGVAVLLGTTCWLARLIEVARMSATEKQCENYVFHHSGPWPSQRPYPIDLRYPQATGTPAVNKPSEGGGISVGIGAGAVLPAEIPIVGEVTVDVDLFSGDTTISFPKIGPGWGYYIAVRFSGTCTGCQPGAWAKIRRCILGGKNAVARAISQLQGRQVAISDAPLQIKLQGEPIDSRDVPVGSYR